MRRTGYRRAAAVFELFYKLAAVAILIPLQFGCFALAMRAEGYSYLTHENILVFLGSPLTLLADAIALLAAAVYLMTDIGAVIFLQDQSAQGTRITPMQTLRFAAANTLRAMRPANAPVILTALALAPLMSAGFIAVFLAAVSVPAPMSYLLRREPVFALAAAATVLLLTVLGIRRLHAVFCFTLEGCSWREAKQRGAHLDRGRRLAAFGVMAGAQAGLAVLALALLLALTALAERAGGLLDRITGQQWPGSYAVWAAAAASLAVTAALSVPVCFGCAGALYRRSRQRAGEPVVHAAAPVPPGQGRRTVWNRVLCAAAAAALLAAATAVLLLTGPGGLNPDVEYLHTVEVTAHRGASARFPENTMAAFAAAYDQGADWIELDVQQTKDGQLVVIHDANLKRTTGVNAYVRDMTYAQLAALDAGAVLGGEHAPERIPLLSQVLAFASENGIKLNIELKPTGSGTDMERAVVDAIHAEGLEDSCVVTSQSYQVLKNVKAYDETITTVYVMRFVYGSIGALDAADHLSVNASSVTRALVSRVHNAGKQLYVWTVNTRRNIDRMIGLNVDNIITDKVDLAKQCVFESRYGGMLEQYIDLLSEDE